MNQRMATQTSQQAGLFSQEEWKVLASESRLPPRLSQIAYLVLCGNGDKQIAASLGIGIPTVRTHMGRLFTKLDVQDRKEVVLFFFRLHRAKSKLLVSS